MDSFTLTAIAIGALVFGGLTLFLLKKFGHKGAFRVKTPFGEAEASGEQKPPDTIPSGVKINKVQAGRDLTATAKGQGGVELEDATAKGNVTATHAPPETPPKP